MDRDGVASQSAEGGGSPKPRVRRGPVPAWLGRLAEPLYRRAINHRNRRFDAGAGVQRLGVPVISVGNLSVGGTGKTPMVMHVLRVLLEGGFKPCVAMRGYTKPGSRKRGGRTGASSSLLIEQAAGSVEAWTGRGRVGSGRAWTDTGAGGKWGGVGNLGFSDEADEYRRAFPDVPIVARPDRIVGLRELLEKPFKPTVDCVVLDDGFQHRQIARDLDIVLVDASHPPMRDSLLPRGYLREPPESLRRASCVVITHAEMCEGDVGGGAALVEDPSSGAACASFFELASFITRHHGHAPLAITSHIWTGLKRARSHNLEDDELLPLDHLLGRRVIAACAIGNPEGFLVALRRALTTDRSRAGALLEQRVLPDHDPFAEPTAKDLARSAEVLSADAIVVTEKDWSKLRAYPSKFWPCPILRPQLSLVFDTGGSAFSERVLGAAGGRGGEGGVTS